MEPLNYALDNPGMVLLAVAAVIFVITTISSIIALRRRHWGNQWDAHMHHAANRQQGTPERKASRRQPKLTIVATSSQA